MTAPYRPKSMVELLANARARARGIIGANAASAVGDWIFSILEISAFADADQYIQINKVLGLSFLDKCKGDDIDRWALSMGALFRADLRRIGAQASVAKVVFGDGTLIVSARLLSDVFAGATSFSVGPGEGDAFPSSGAVALERGTARFERAVYVRTGDVFSVPAGLAFAHASYGEVARVATQSDLAAGILVAGTTATLRAGTGAAWPTSGTVILDRATASRESRAFTRSGDVLTLSLGTTFAHAIGATAHLSTNGSDRVVGSGVQPYVPATQSSKQVTFRTLSSVTLFDGDFQTDVVDAQCLLVGADTNVGSAQVSLIASSPFSGATVTNPLPAFGGADREKDDAYVRRLKSFIAGWGGKSALSIETFVVGLKDEATNRKVAFAQVIEPVENPGTSTLYITDGSASFSIEREVFVGRDVAISNATVGDRRGKLSLAAPFLKQAQPIASRTPRVYISVNRGTSTLVGANFLEDSTQNMVANAYANMYLKAADDQFYRITSNTSVRFILAAGGATPAAGPWAVLDISAFSTPSSAYVVSSSTGVSANTLTDALQAMTVNEHADHYLLDSLEHLWRITANTATAFTLDASGATPAAGAYRVVLSTRSLPLVPDVDYFFNEATGHLKVPADALLAHDAVVAAADGASPSVGAYTYATGLGALVQKAVNGEPPDFSLFPGRKAHGDKILVAAPTVVSPSFVISILPAPRVSLSGLLSAVKVVLQAYVNGLGIGEDITISEIIKRVKSIPGVADVTLVQPTTNYPVADEQLARITADDVDVI